MFSSLWDVDRMIHIQLICKPAFWKLV